MLECSIELMRYEKSISNKIKLANLKFEEKSQNEDVECLKNRKQNLDLACLNRRQVALTDFYELQEEISILSKEQDDKRLMRKFAKLEENRQKL